MCHSYFSFAFIQHRGFLVQKVEEPWEDTSNFFIKVYCYFLLKFSTQKYIASCINSFENHSFSVNDSYLNFGSTIQLLSTGTALGEPISMQALALPNFCFTSFNTQCRVYSCFCLCLVLLLILCSLAGFIGCVRLVHINLQWSSNNSISHILKRSLIIKRGMNSRA